MIQDRAQFAENGHVLCQDCNAVLDHPGSSLRASRETLVRGVALLGKVRATTGEARLAVKRCTTR